jgi:hypothetical protein
MDSSKIFEDNCRDVEGTKKDTETRGKGDRRKREGDIKS